LRSEGDCAEENYLKSVSSSLIFQSEGHYMIKVMIVDDSRLNGGLIASTLEREHDIEVIGIATGAAEAFALISQPDIRCDVLLVTNNIPALELIQALKNVSPVHVKSIVIGVPVSEQVAVRYIEAGAAGYVSKDDSVPDLVENIRAVHSGRALIAPSIAALLIARVAELAKLPSNSDAGAESWEDLTSREKEVFDLIGEGLSNREIANRLVIQLGTVKNHVHNVLRKLDVRDRQEVAECWYRKVEGSPDFRDHPVS
jgi:two-component system nitrate/nitrite response regulator NarL